MGKIVAVEIKGVIYVPVSSRDDSDALREAEEQIKREYHSSEIDKLEVEAIEIEDELEDYEED